MKKITGLLIGAEVRGLAEKDIDQAIHINGIPLRALNDAKDGEDIWIHIPTLSMPCSCHIGYPEAGLICIGDTQMTTIPQNAKEQHSEPARRLLIDVSKLTQDVTCEVCDETFEIVPHWHLKFVTCGLCETVYEIGIGGI